MSTAPSQTAKPIFIYDGNCNFCRKWVLRLQRLVGNKIDFSTSAAAADHFPKIDPEKFEQSIQYITPNGTVLPAAFGCFTAIAQHPLGKITTFLYRHLPGFAALSEAIYRLVAHHRTTLSKIDVALTGLNGTIPTYTITSRIFPKALALIYLISFANLILQIDGLIGSNGIIPVENFLNTVYQYFGSYAIYKLPTLFWLNHSDFMLHAVCLCGILLAIAVFFDLIPSLGFFLLWVLYLSIVCVGNIFLSFQWDTLLLETGFLAIFGAPLVWRLGRNVKFTTPGIVRWLILFLAFRLMFTSGALKLLNDDPTWHNLSALQYHFETQPLPSPLAFFIHQSPPWFLQLAAIITLFIETILPFAIFGPRRLQLTAAGGLIFLQILIYLTGNYGIFNLLSIILFLWLIDDVTWYKLVHPFRRVPSISTHDPIPALNTPTVRRWRWYLLIPLTLWLALITIPVTLTNLNYKINWPLPLQWVQNLAAPFHSINTYGLFTVMTTERREVNIQGSIDGKTWFDYDFKWKPDQLDTHPSFCQPYLPRLDFQLWFIPFRPYQQNPWLISLCQELLLNNKTVLSLLARNPFPDHPPKFLRVNLIQYHFNTYADWKNNGNWWITSGTKPYITLLYLKHDNEN